jgi:hypothetical protein
MNIILILLGINTSLLLCIKLLARESRMKVFLALVPIQVGFLTYIITNWLLRKFMEPVIIWSGIAVTLVLSILAGNWMFVKMHAWLKEDK